MLSATIPLRPATRLHGLDTLRAVAILLVMVYHLGSALPPAFQPIVAVGWSGVDLFFVLSGYLIGVQLLRRPIRLAGFYRRRALRILPAYLAVLLLYLFVPVWREQPHLPATWKLLTFTANLFMHFPQERAFSHVWSLCIEEHFYLVLPALILVVGRVTSFRRVTILLALALLGGFALRSWQLFHVVLRPGLDDDQSGALFMTRLYYPTYTRLDGLILGVALALVQLFRPAWWARLETHPNRTFAAGLALTALGMLLFHADYPSPEVPAGILFGFPVLSLGYTLLTASAATGRGLLARRIPGAGLLAILAFSLYLTHKEAAHLLEHLLPALTDQPSWRTVPLYAFTCLAVAAPLYLLVERPFLRLRDQPPATLNPAL